MQKEHLIKEAKADGIDWANSYVASGQGLIYLLLSPVDPNYQKIRQEISTKLAALRLCNFNLQKKGIAQ